VTSPLAFIHTKDTVVDGHTWDLILGRTAPPSPWGLRRRRALPEGAILGTYASFDGGVDKCAERVSGAVHDGVNLIFWAFIGMSVQLPSGDPEFTSGFNEACFVRVHANLTAAGIPDVTHMITYGGWNSPRWPRGGGGAGQWFEAWETWNRDTTRRLSAAGADGFAGFDGLDWDMEGNDDAASDRNDLDVASLDLFGSLSVAMKHGGYLTTMVPPESYLDPTDDRFDTRLNLTYHGEFTGIDFPHHGRNCFAYLLAKYGHTELEGDEAAGGGGGGGGLVGGGVTLVTVPVFDLVTVQLYESYTHALHRTAVEGADPAAYLQAWAESLYRGWDVRFGDYFDRTATPAMQEQGGERRSVINVSAGPRELGNVRVAVEPARLAIGLGNAWACCPPPPGAAPVPARDLGRRRSAFFWPEAVGEARSVLAARGEAFRGVVFWEAASEGEVPYGETKPLYFARECNAFLKTRRPGTG